jgi:Na+-driven multidrug efflux pump
VNAQSIVLVVMLALDLVWMPEYGAVGAAFASTVAYVASTLYTVWAYSRSTGTPSWTCLIVHWSDFRFIREIGSGVLTKLRWRRS